MQRMHNIRLAICIAALGAATLGFAGIPDPPMSHAVMFNALPNVNMSVCNVPDGSGHALTEARHIASTPGTWENATITLTLLDGASNPVFDYPYEDLWLENPPAIPDDPIDQYDVPGLVACPNGTVADANTDINGDGIWSTDTDVIVFSTWYPPDPSDPPSYGYHYGVDYYFDGVNDISDLVLFSAAQNVSCP